MSLNKETVIFLPVPASYGPFLRHPAVNKNQTKLDMEPMYLYATARQVVQWQQEKKSNVKTEETLKNQKLSANCYCNNEEKESNNGKVV